MIKSFINQIGVANFVLLLVVLSIIVVSEYVYISGNKLDAIFIGLWAPTILGFMIYLKRAK
ncbi:hypothetical protein ABN763_14610 [Spongiivirga sp. MCCC 1A20706]|uniref:hypothetical protein n=1 Tax=Spongiivirga sp. MCCC 1A20706 TaxID=3160963 RepID=UPI003977DBF7